MSVHSRSGACRPLRLAALAATAMAGLVAGCAATPDATTTAGFEAQRTTVHRDGDDLLTAGLGSAGLQAMVPPAFADPAAPSPAELRRRALWSNWRGIADLSPAGGYGRLYGSLEPVPGREFSAYARVPGARQPHRVLVQLPDAFDAQRRCVVVAASSGSRGVHGAIAVAGAWGLRRGCAVAYTDKGAGTDYFDLDAGVGVRADGTVAAANAADDLAFRPQATDGASGVSYKHAHSQDNPEADWGVHVRQAADFALEVLDRELPGAGRFDHANTRVIAVGISNGGGAVLQAAAEPGGDWLDAVVAGEPNVHVEGARPLYDYTTEAALLMPCALLDLDDLPQPPLRAQVTAAATQRCATLAAHGLVAGADLPARAADAHARLRASGWEEGALRAAALSTGFDLWRAVAAGYAQAYLRAPAGAHVCGYGYAVQGPAAAPRAATVSERAAWFADASGIPPGAGVQLVDGLAGGADQAWPGLACLRALWTGTQPDGQRLREAVAATRVEPPRRDLPVLVVHGRDDGLVPVAFSSRPYVESARAAGSSVAFWEVPNAQHFDGFLVLPDYGARYVPLLPHVYAALDAVDAHLDGAAFPEDRVFATTPRGAAPLDAGHLGLEAR